MSFLQRIVSIMPKRPHPEDFPVTALKKHAHQLNLRFKHPARIMVCGPSNSGKTTLIAQIFERRADMFEHPVTDIVWYYGSWQPTYDRLKKMGVRLKGLPEAIENDFPQKTPPNEVRILVLDDGMKDAVNDPNVLRLFVEKSHHQGTVTAIMTTQNFYHQRRHAVDMARNISVAIFIIELRNMDVIRRFLQSCYNKQQVRQIMAWIRCRTYRKPYSNVTFDLDMATDDACRIRLNLFPNQVHGPKRLFTPSLYL